MFNIKRLIKEEILKEMDWGDLSFDFDIEDEDETEGGYHASLTRHSTNPLPSSGENKYSQKNKFKIKHAYQEQEPSPAEFSGRDFSKEKKYFNFVPSIKIHSEDDGDYILGNIKIMFQENIISTITATGQIVTPVSYRKKEISSSQDEFSIHFGLRISALQEMYNIAQQKGWENFGFMTTHMPKGLDVSFRGQGLAQKAYARFLRYLNTQKILQKISSSTNIEIDGIFLTSGGVNEMFATITPGAKKVWQRDWSGINKQNFIAWI